MRPVLLCLAVGCTTAHTHTDDEHTDLPTETDALVDCEDPVDEIRGDAGCGAGIFAATCAECHGDHGQGTLVGANLHEHVHHHDDAALLSFLALGTGDMPPQGLEGPEPAHVLAFLRAAFGEYEGEH